MPNSVKPVLGLPSVGEVFDEWQIEESLGRGGMGAVFRATHTVKGLRAALKILTVPETRELEQFSRFRREVQVMGRLDHPSLVKILQEALAHDPPYFVMELVEGGNLLQRILACVQASGKGLAPVDIARLALQVAEGLAEAHGHGVLHRDIKPSNILFTPDGKAKIADFGLAKAPDMTILTVDRVLMGTLAYVAPEVLRGGPATPRSDLYQLGITLYQTATGQLPYGSDSVNRALSGEELPPLPSVAALGLNVRLEKAIASLTASNPEARPRSAQEAVAMLRVRRTTTSMPAHALLSRAAQPVASPGFGLRRRGLVMASVAAASLLGLGVVYFRGIGPVLHSTDAVSPHRPAVSGTVATTAHDARPANPVPPGEPASILRLLEESLAADRRIVAEVEAEQRPDGKHGLLARAFLVNTKSIAEATLRVSRPRSGAASAPGDIEAQPSISIETLESAVHKELPPLRATIENRSWSLRVDPAVLREGFNRFHVSDVSARAAPEILIEIRRSPAFPGAWTPRPPADKDVTCPGSSQALAQSAVYQKTGEFTAALASAKSVLDKQPACAEALLAVSRTLNRIAEIRLEGSGAGMMEAWSMITVSSELEAIPTAELLDQSDRKMDLIAHLYPGWSRIWQQYAERFQYRKAWDAMLRACRWRVVVSPKEAESWTGLATSEAALAASSPAAERRDSWTRRLLDALRHADEGLRLCDPRSGDAGFHEMARGHLLKLLGRTTEARGAFERAGRSKSAASEARRELTRLGGDKGRSR